MYNIKIKVSNNMTNCSGIYTKENQMLRLDQPLRLLLNLEIGQQLSLQSNDGRSVVLQVGTSFQEDNLADAGVCYVTKQVFDLINVEGTDSYKLDPVKNITLGCDPEFFLIDRYTKKMLRAYAFFKKYGEIGHDGILAEIRPKPSLTPEGLTDNIYELLCNSRYILNNNTVYAPERIMMYAASGYQTATAGFHLHFGLPKNILGKNPGVVSLIKQVVKVMDYYVGLPSIMIEGESDADRRANIFVNYGKPGDFRLDNRTLEYRVAGGNILRHPLITRGLIALGAVVAQDIVSRIKLSTNGFRQLYWANSDERFKELYPNVLNTQEIYKLICCPNTTEARKHLGDIFHGVQNMVGYREKRVSIDKFFKDIETNNIYNNDIETNWRTFYDQPAQLHQPFVEKTIISAGS